MLPAKSLPQLITYARANPGKLSIGHTGTGTISNLAVEAFKESVGIDVVIVPYRGFPPLAADLLAGRIHATIDNIAGSIDHVRAGTLKLLAVTTAARSHLMPDVPTIGESIPGYEAVAVAGFGAPKGKHPDIIGILNAQINLGLADPDVRSRLKNLGVTVVGGTPAKFEALIARETERWNHVIRKTGIKPN